MGLVDDTVGCEMVYCDLAFLIKVLYDTEGVKEEAPFFDFNLQWYRREECPVVKR